MHNEFFSLRKLYEEQLLSLWLHVVCAWIFTLVASTFWMCLAEKFFFSISWVLFLRSIAKATVFSEQLCYSYKCWLELVGKFIIGYVPVCGEKEYYLACACEELYAPPSAYFSLYGLTVQASFLGGWLIFQCVGWFHLKLDKWQTLSALLWFAPIFSPFGKWLVQDVRSMTLCCANFAYCLLKILVSTRWWKFWTIMVILYVELPVSFLVSIILSHLLLTCC